MDNINNLNPLTTLQNGKYQIIKTLGQGGFGITYIVYHTLLKKQFALKEFFPKDYCNREADTTQMSVATLANQQLVERLRVRFITEAQNIAALNHPNIIGIHDVFEENGTAYFVMDYIEGSSLEEIVKRDGALSPAKSIEYITKIASALEYLHGQNMTHYDIKPANIMLRDSDCQPILIDFGLSKQYDNAGRSHSTLLVGLSHGYSPLEQYFSDGISEFSPASDIYSLGATLYTLLTGRIPPEAPKLMGQTIELPIDVPGSLRRTVQWAMASDVKQRCYSAREFKNALISEAPSSLNITDGGTQIVHEAFKPKEYARPSTSKTVESDFRPNNESDINNKTPYEYYAARKETEDKSKNGRRSGNHRLVIGFLLICLVITLGLVIYLFKSYQQNNTAAPKAAEEIETAVETQSEEDAETGTESQVTSQEKELILPNKNNSSVLLDGENIYDGTFTYEGADYDFVVRMYYDESTGTITKATYEPQGYSGLTNLTTATINGDALHLKGGNTEITAKLNDSSIPEFEGRMTRGNHSGPIIMSVR